MAKVSKLVWVGIIINIISISSMWFFSLLDQDIIDELSYDDRQIIRISSLAVIPITIATVIQIISIPVLFKIPRLGFILALLGSIISLPLSLVFWTGYLLSYENHYNRNYAMFKQQPLDAFLTFNTTKLAVQGVIFTVLGLGLMIVGVENTSFFGAMTTGFGIIIFYIAYRQKNKVMIGLAQDKLVLTPSMYTETYFIPLRDVSLIKDTSRLFKLRIKSTDVDRKCTFRKKFIAEDNYQETLKNILSKLSTQESI